MISDKKVLLFLFAVFLLIYSMGSFSRIPFGDSIGFSLYAERGEFIDSTSTYSHFLFSNTIVLFKKILPFIEGREIARWVTIISAALCIPILYKTCFLVSNNKFASISTSILFGLGFSFWRNAEIIEIYTFNLLIIGIFLHLTLLTILHKRDHLFIYCSFILGISLFSHIQNILLYPAFGILLLIKASNKTKFTSIIILGVLFLSLFIFPFKNNEPLSSVYSSGVVSEKIHDTNILKSLILALGYLFYNFWHFLIFSISGIFILYKTNKQVFFFLIGSAIPIFIFSIIFGVSDNYVYFIPFNFIIAVCTGLGMSHLFSLKIRKWFAATVILIPAFYFLSYKIVDKLPQAESFAKLKSYKGGLRYYLLPWMNDNVGIVEFTLDKKTAPESLDWMTRSAEEYIQLLKIKGYNNEEIRKF